MSTENNKEETVQVAENATAPETAQAPSADAAPAEKPKEMVPRKALLDERAKRQKAAEDAAYWRGQAEMAARQAGATPAQAKTAAAEFSDADYYNRPAETIAKIRAQAKEEAKAEVLAEISQRERDAFTRRANSAAARARKRYGAEKYNEAEAAFMAELSRDPSLRDQLLAEPDPAEFAWQWHEERNAPPPLSADERAELESYRKQKKPVGDKPTIPQSNAGARGPGSSSAVVRTRKTPDQILAAAGIK